MWLFTFFGRSDIFDMPYASPDKTVGGSVAPGNGAAAAGIAGLIPEPANLPNGGGVCPGTEEGTATGGSS